MWSWFKLPSLPGEEDARRARQLTRMLAIMVALACLGLTAALFEPRNEKKVTLLFYGVVLGWLMGAGLETKDFPQLFSKRAVRTAFSTSDRPPFPRKAARFAFRAQLE